MNRSQNGLRIWNLITSYPQLQHLRVWGASRFRNDETSFLSRTDTGVCPYKIHKHTSGRGGPPLDHRRTPNGHGCPCLPCDQLYIFVFLLKLKLGSYFWTNSMNRSQGAP